MIIARVTGTVVATAKEPKLEGMKMLLLQPTDASGQTAKGSPVVAIDAVGAGLHDLVLYAAGSSARQTEITKDKPVDAVVMAIVDLIENQGGISYRKG
ncbi:MAG: EutN/CcmL family microcompartment protein [Deltaproteobacteria bacterium]|nr:EutN/CcmL family microcompartment protein [Deltaproteobacteria bacterium]